jgi:hypothetical protein
MGGTGKYIVSLAYLCRVTVARKVGDVKVGHGAERFRLPRRCVVRAVEHHSLADVRNH